MGAVAVQRVQEGGDDGVEGAAVAVRVAAVGEDDGVDAAHVRAQVVGGHRRGLDDLHPLRQGAAGPSARAAGLGAHGQAARQRLLHDDAADLTGRADGKNCGHDAPERVGDSKDSPDESAPVAAGIPGTGRPRLTGHPSGRP